jgi:hypothetical protein
LSDWADGFVDERRERPNRLSGYRIRRDLQGDFCPNGLHPPLDERNNTPETGAAFTGSHLSALDFLSASPQTPPGKIKTKTFPSASLDVTLRHLPALDSRLSALDAFRPLANLPVASVANDPMTFLAPACPALPPVKSPVPPRQLPGNSMSSRHDAIECLILPSVQSLVSPIGSIELAA